MSVLDLSVETLAMALGCTAAVPLALMLASGPLAAAPAPALSPCAAPAPLGPAVLAVGQRFLGRPYEAGSLDTTGTRERLVCRTDAFDCVTFVENALAIARAQRAADPAGYPGQLERLRYRRGRRDGYASRFHYFSEWIQDNGERGLVRDCSEAFGGVADPRPLHFMTRHRDAYPALKNPHLFRSIEQIETQLNLRPRFYIPTERVPAALPRIQDGDILAITTRIDGLDVCHVGLAWRQTDGQVHLLHASSDGASVQLSDRHLLDYLRARSSRTGIMVARPL
jgi:hypothetical protein